LAGPAVFAGAAAAARAGELRSTDFAGRLSRDAPAIGVDFIDADPDALLGRLQNTGDDRSDVAQRAVVLRSGTAPQDRALYKWHRGYAG
jgi:hypothetical protein